MLRKFLARNYRSIENETLHLEPLSVFVGPNGSGKTNLFRGLELFGELLYAGSTEPALEDAWDAICYRGARTRSTIQFGASLKVPLLRSDESAKDEVWVDIDLTLRHSSSDDDVTVQSEHLGLRRYVDGKWHTLSVTADGKHSVQAEPGDDPVLWEMAVSDFYFDNPKRALTRQLVTGLLQSRHARSQHRADSQDAHVLVLNQLFRSSFWYTRFVIPQCRVRRYRMETASLRGYTTGAPAPPRGQLGLSGEGLPDVIDRLRREDGLQPVLQEMRSVLPRLNNVTTERHSYGRRTLLFHEDGHTRPLPDTSVSDGTLHTLAILALLAPEKRTLISRGRVIVLEELENAVHPWAVAALLRAAENATLRNLQVLISTHSPVVVDSTPVRSLFVVENEGANTSITRAESIRAGLKDRLDRSGMTLGETWLHGMIGGNPLRG